MGYSAFQGSSGSVTDQVTATDLPSGIVFPERYDPIVVMQNQQVTIPVNTNCNCAAPIKNYTIKAILPTGLSYTAGTGTASGNVVSFTPINYLTANAPDSELLTLTASGAGCTIDSVINDNRDNRKVGGLTNTDITGGSSWQTTGTYYNSPTHAWQGIDDTLITTFSLNSAPFIPGSLSVLSFEHLYEMENSFDGGIVEYTTNGGSTWVDAAPLFIKNPYNGYIDATSVSAIPGRQAFTGSSNSKFVHSLVNLSSLSGKSTIIRFRVNTDAGNTTGYANAGWVLDDISVSNGCGGMIKLMVYDSANNLRDSTSIPVFIIPNILPVTYASFNVQQVSKQTLLRWVIATETNINFYSVERSADGSAWTSIGTTQALGINNEEYDFYDQSPMNGVNYYRIQAVDSDGRFTYSDVRELNISKDADPVLIVPNPSQYQSKVYIASSSTSIKVGVYDAQGRLISSNRLVLANGMFSLNTSQYADGIYILYMETDDGNKYTEKLIIHK